MTLSANIATLATRIATEFKANGVITSGIRTDLTALEGIVQQMQQEGNGVGIDDGTTSNGSVWSSAKTDAENKAQDTVISGIRTDLTTLETAVDGIDVTSVINDVSTSTSSTWSSTKIAADNASQNTTIQGVRTDLTTLQQTVDNIDVSSVIDDSGTSTTKTWSSSKADAEIKAAVAALVDSAPEALDTLRELAEAIQAEEGTTVTILEKLGQLGDLERDYVAVFEAGLV